MISLVAISNGKSVVLYLVNSYLAEGGEAQGWFVGKAKDALRLPDRVTPKLLEDLLNGYCRGVKLVQNAGTSSDRQFGWHMTLNPPKSFSIAKHIVSADLRKAMEEALEKAVKNTLKYLEEEAGFSRRGHGGHTLERAQLLFSVHAHETSRAGDMQSHYHVLIMNLGIRGDFSTGTIVSHFLYLHQTAANAILMSTLASELLKLGFELEQKGNSFELKRIPSEVIKHFSKRRQQINERMEQKGYTSLKAADYIALDTRPRKEVHSMEENRQRWAKEIEGLGLSVTEVEQAVKPAQHLKLKRKDNKALMEDAVRIITERASFFSERELLRIAANEAMCSGLGGEEIRDLVKKYLKESTSVVQLNTVDHEQKYTSAEMLGLERRLEEKIQSQGVGAEEINREKIEAVLKAHNVLESETAMAVRHVLGGVGRIKVLTGIAGSGKSMCLRLANQCWVSEGLKVYGVAVAANTASALGVHGIEGCSLQKFLGRVRDNRIVLDRNSVIAFDEAGMAGTRKMLELVEIVEKAGARLILIGDKAQLQPIEAGNSFAFAEEKLGAAKLTKIRRQREGWAKQAVESIVKGESRKVLSEYDKRGLLKVSDTGLQAISDTVEAWSKEGAQKPACNLIIASANNDVTTLNRFAQAKRREAGLLGKEEVCIGSEYFSSGDRVIFTKNSPALGVNNGMFGTVAAVHGKSISVRLDSGKLVSFNSENYQHLRLAYSVTTFKAQGVSVENAFVFLNPKNQERETSYVQLSRARGTTMLFANKVDFGESLHQLARMMAKQRLKEMAMQHLPGNEQKMKFKI